jgi:Na+-driven multidrug efflux pump
MPWRASTLFSGGVAAAMARAMGAGRHDDARALVLHALALGTALAFLFTLLAWTIAPTLYRLLGGEGRSLDHALAYSHVLFSGALLIWANFFLSALLRGGGDAATPGRYMLFSSIAQVPLSYVLALGIGDWPGLGMAGPAISSLLTSAVSALLQARALWGGRLGFVPTFAGLRLQGRLFWDILRVGLIASFSAFTANLTAMLVTGFVGRFGVAALAGYGIGVRLEFMLVPLAFGIGSGLTTLVGVRCAPPGRAAWWPVSASACSAGSSPSFPRAGRASSPAIHRWSPPRLPM